MPARVQGVGAVRMNLACHHLMAAAMYARKVHSIEQANAKEPFGPFFDEIMWHVSACVMMSVAAVEAHFNEQMSNLPADDTLRELISRKPLIDRHNYYLWFAKKPRLALDQSPAEPFACLISLRNELVHFQPEWESEQKRHARLATRLDGRFPTSPFFSKSEVLFPRRCMSHGCAAWAVRCAQEFGDEFAARIGRESPFQKFADRLSTQ